MKGKKGILFREKKLIIPTYIFDFLTKTIKIQLSQ